MLLVTNSFAANSPKLVDCAFSVNKRYINIQLLLSNESVRLFSMLHGFSTIRKIRPDCRHQEQEEFRELSAHISSLIYI